jgi:hypothetical protein
MSHKIIRAKPMSTGKKLRQSQLYLLANSLWNLSREANLTKPQRQCLEDAAQELENHAQTL